MLTGGVPADGLRIRTSTARRFDGATHARVQRTGEIMLLDHVSPKTIFAAERGVEGTNAAPLIEGDLLDPIIWTQP